MLKVKFWLWIQAKLIIQNATNTNHYVFRGPLDPRLLEDTTFQGVLINLQYR